MTRCLRRLLLTLILTAFLNNFPNNSSTNTTVTKYSFSLAQFWTSLLSFFAELQKELHPLTKENRELNAVFTEQRNLFIELAACSAQIKSKAELLKLFEFTTNKLLALEKVLQQVAIAAIPRTSRGMDGQLLLTEQITVTCKKQLTKLQQILRQIALFKEIICFSEAVESVDGSWSCICGRLEFESATARNNFNQNNIARLTPDNLAQFGIIKMQRCVTSSANFQANLQHSETPPEWKNHAQTITSGSTRAPQKQALKFNNATQPIPAPPDTSSFMDNLNVSGQTFSSHEVYYFPPPQPEANPAQQAFLEVNQFFAQNNVAKNFYAAPNQKFPGLKETLGDLGQKLKDRSKLQFFEFERNSAENSPTNNNSNNSGGAANAAGGNPPPNKPGHGNKSNETKLPQAVATPALLTEQDVENIKISSAESLMQQGTFRHFSPIANKNLCQISGHFYAKGIQDMAHRLDEYVAQKDRFFTEIQDDHRNMQHIFMQLQQPVPKILQEKLAAEHKAAGNQLPGDLLAPHSQVNAECTARTKRAVADFQQGLPLPKKFLTELSTQNRQDLLHHAEKTIGRAREMNAMLLNMHLFSTAALSVGFTNGCFYADQEIAQQLAAEKQQHLQTRSQLEEERKNRDEAFAKEKQQLKLTAGFAAKQAQEAKTALGKAEADKQKAVTEKQTAEQHAQQAAEKLQTAEADKQKAEVELERKNQENQKLKTLAMHALSNTQTKNSAPGTAPQENGSTKSSTLSNHALEAENSRLRAENLMYKKQSIDLQSAPPKEVRVFIPNPNISEAEMTEQIKGQLQAEEALRADKKIIAEKGLELNAEHQRIEKMEESQAKLLAQNKHQEKELELKEQKIKLLEEENAVQQSLLNYTENHVYTVKPNNRERNDEASK